MPDRADCARRDTEILCDSRRLTVRVEREQHDEPVPLGERAQARHDARRVERCDGRRRRLHRSLHESRGQRFPPPRDPAFGVSHHPAGPQDERSDFLRPAHFTGVQPLDREQQNVLCEVVGGRIVLQVPAAVQPHARREAAIQLRLLGIGRSRQAASDSARDRFVADGLERCLRVRHQPDGTQAACGASTGTAPSRRCSMSAAERSAAPPSPTNVDPCMAASTRGCRSASSFRRRRVAGVSGM